MIGLAEAGVRLGRTQVLEAVTLEVAAGRWTMLVGPNGVGKTSLLRAVAGHLRYTGSIRLDGREVARMPERQRARQVAVVSQGAQLPPDMTVGEYVLLGRTPHLGYLGRPSGRDRSVAARTVRNLGLELLSHRQLQRLSGGERQRAVLARALAQDAPVLLLDEPTTALDLGRQQELLDLVARLRAERGLAVLGATHDLTLAAQYADSMVLLDAGRVVRAGRPHEVLTEELVSRHYRARVRVEHHDGLPVVLPAPAAGATPEVGQGWD